MSPENHVPGDSESPGTLRVEQTPLTDHGSSHDQEIPGCIKKGENQHRKGEVIHNTQAIRSVIKPFEWKQAKVKGKYRKECKPEQVRRYRRDQKSTSGQDTCPPPIFLPTNPCSEGNTNSCSCKDGSPYEKQSPGETSEEEVENRGV